MAAKSGSGVYISMLHPSFLSYILLNILTPIERAHNLQYTRTSPKSTKMTIETRLFINNEASNDIDHFLSST